MSTWYSVCVGSAPGVYASMDAARAAMGPAAEVPVPLCVTCTTKDAAQDILARFLPPKTKDLIVVYVDGSCTGNGGARASAGVGVYWGPGHRDNVSRPVSGPVHTNNVGELQAILDALTTIRRAVRREPRRVFTDAYRIMSDSTYSIKATTEWFDSWRARGWKTSSGDTPANLDLVRVVHDVLGLLVDKGLDIKLLYTPAHKRKEFGPGNDAADALAKAGAAFAEPDGAGSGAGAGAGGAGAGAGAALASGRHMTVPDLSDTSSESTVPPSESESESGTEAKVPTATPVPAPAPVSPSTKRRRIKL